MEVTCLGSDDVVITGVVESNVYREERYAYSVVQYQPTKRPIEDRYSFLDKDGRLILGVYDGHGGSATAEYVSKELPSRLIKDSPTVHPSGFVALDKSMTESFVKDHSLLQLRSKDWARNAELIKSGCTALVCDIDFKSMTATVSNAGDCRLVVYRRHEPDAPVEVIHETIDLNAKSSAEADRLRSEHPNEDMMIVGGRLFGNLMSTRGFGDGYYKLPIQGVLGKRNHKRYIEILSSIEKPDKVPMNAQYESYFYGYRTPPYITARPETATVALLPGDIVLIASDGLWDVVSSEDVASFITRSLPQSGQTESLALSILVRTKDVKRPGDDVTILVLSIHPDDN